MSGFFYNWMKAQADALGLHDALAEAMQTGTFRPLTVIEAEFTVNEWTETPLVHDEPHQRGHIEGDYRLTATVPPD